VTGNKSFDTLQLAAGRFIPDFAVVVIARCRKPQRNVVFTIAKTSFCGMYLLKAHPYHSVKKREKNITHSPEKPLTEHYHAGKIKRPPLNVLTPEILLVGIFIGALLIRLLYIKQVMPTPIFSGLATDAEEYNSLALYILRGDFTLKDFIYLNSLYPFFLALIYFISGQSHLGVVIIQAVIDAFSCLLIYYTALTLFNKRVGIIASFIYACYGMAIFYTGILLASTVEIFLTLTFIALLLFVRERRNLLFLFIAGIVFGLAVLSRSNLILFLFFLPFWFFTVFKNKRGTADAVRGFVYLLTGFCMIIALISIRNYSIIKEFTPSVVGGINFYKGNNPNATGSCMLPQGVSSSPLEELKTSIEYAGKETGTTLTPSQASQYWLFKGLTFIKDNPLDAASLYVKKFTLFWRKEELSVSIDYALSKTLVPLLRLPFISFGLIAPLALLGLILVFKRKNTFLITLFTFSYMLSVIIFFISGRYRLPVVPFLIIFASFTLSHVIELLRAKEIKRIATIVAVFILLFIGINYNFGYVTRPPSNTHYSNLGRIYVREGRLDEALTALEKALLINPDAFEARTNLGIVYSKKGLIEEAIGEYQKALKINPDYGPAHTNLGNIYGSTGRPDEAMAEFQKAIASNPDNAEAHYNLGIIYRSKGMFSEAIDEYKKTLAVNPTIAEAHYNLGTVYARTGKIDEAVKAYRLALELKPRSELFSTALANTYLQKGEFEQAISQYEHALTLNPRHDKAHHNLGVAYMRTERLDEAISAYRKAIELNPRYTKAYYNLGSVYGQKGMFDEAIAAFTKALTFDPTSVKIHFNRALAYDKQGKLDEAIMEYNEVLALNPRYTKAHQKIAAAYYLKKNYRLALVHCDKVVALGGRVDPQLLESLKSHR
jgi:tetratricopeptide (TPR) repeat protein